ncbi:ead/Ea22-like family protein [Enterobacter sp. CPE_E1214]|uniref:ead/Ea22-like family protein n=1 Tax=unclassified Enterobacter TaxID=2608935 RepID=UPI0038902C76
MSNIDKRALRESANAANATSWGNWESYKPHKGARGYEVKVGVKAVAQHCLKVDSVFIAAANPATVLALLDELEESERLRLKFQEANCELCQKLEAAEKISAARLGAIDTTHKMFQRERDRAEKAEKRIAELERKEQHSDRQSVIDALASSGEEWSDIEEYMQKWDAERASTAGKGE